MMERKIIWATVGKLLIVIGFGMFLPLAAALYYHEREVWVFAVSIAVTIGAGALLSRVFRTDERMRIKDGYAIVTLGWLLAAAFGMLPYLLSGAVDNLADAVFETMSGFTTTGASIFGDVESLSKSILLWRALTQWLGGVGILVLFIALLSGLGNTGMQLFKAEISQAVNEKLMPRISDEAKILWGIYLLLTIAAVIGYWLCGMELFDALCHGLTTVATGGFSTKNSSIGTYQNAGIEWVGITIMLLCGLNLALYYNAWRAKHKLQSLFKVPVVRFYLTLYGLLIAIVVLNLLEFSHMSVNDAVRTAAFQVISVGTTTGFATADFEAWPQTAKFVLIMAMFIGGCAGSTSGNIKVDRYWIMLKQVNIELQKTLHPRLVSNIKSEQYTINDENVIRTAVFLFLYLLILVLAVLIFTLMDLSIMDAFMAAVTSLGNIGVVMGSFGPAECYAAFPTAGKFLMSFLMLLGRLEIYTVFAAVLPDKKGKC